MTLAAFNWMTIGDTVEARLLYKQRLKYCASTYTSESFSVMGERKTVTNYSKKAVLSIAVNGQ